MVRKNKRTPIPINAQIQILGKDYPDGEVKSRSLRHLVWETDIIPSPNSAKYRIRINYTIGQRPNVYVIDSPVLKRSEGEKFLPHVFSTEQQQICLHYGPFGEWDDSMFLARKIVPWASEWLLFYELWVITGKWLGEGVEHSGKVPNAEQDQTEVNKE